MAPGLTHTIARQFTTLWDWEDCIFFAVVGSFFPDSSAILVADNRSEIGIAYNDRVFTTGLRVRQSTRSTPIRSRSTPVIAMMEGQGQMAVSMKETLALESSLAITTPFLSGWRWPRYDPQLGFRGVYDGQPNHH